VRDGRRLAACEEKQEKGTPLFGRRSAHFCPQCGQFRAFEVTLFPAKKQAGDAFIGPKTGRCPQFGHFL